MVYAGLILLCITLTMIPGSSPRACRERRMQAALIIVWILMTLVAGLRDYSVGTDTSGTYLSIYNHSLSRLGGIRDTGYGLLNRAVRLTVGNYSGVLLVDAAITYGLILHAIWKRSDSVTLSVFLLFATDFFFIAMNMMRQAIAVAIFIEVFPLIHSSKPLDLFKYIVGSLVAVSMHSSGALLFVGYALIRYVKLTPRSALCLTLLNCLLSLSISSGLTILLNYFPYWNTYFGWYLTSADYKPQFSLFGVLIPTAVAVLMSFVYEQAKDDYEYRDLFLCMVLSSNIAIYSSVFPLVERVSIYFYMQAIVCLPCVYKYFKDTLDWRMWQVLTIVGYALYMVITIYVQGQEAVLPYMLVFT